MASPRGMEGPYGPASRGDIKSSSVAGALRALGGEGTLGDLVALTGHASQDVEDALERLIARGPTEVRVSESGELIYHLSNAGRRARPIRGLLSRTPAAPKPSEAQLRDARRAWFDRRTLRLIRAREGVISLAELVEHTGLPLAEAEREMDRLAASYGGKPLPSWDGHVVHLFPELMASAHGTYSVREPRPAWVSAADPMRIVRSGARASLAATIVDALGLLGSVAAPWLLAFNIGLAGPGLLVSSLVSAAGVVFFGRRLGRALHRHPAFRFRRPETLRRYALGHVVETALKGKGVVSLDRTVKYLQARAGTRTVKRSAVEKALRELAREFDAPITEVGGDLFFGFRNVKRQFLAADVQRRRLRLSRVAHGATVFDSGDNAMTASERELELFDRELRPDTSTQLGTGS